MALLPVSLGHGRHLMYPSGRIWQLGAMHAMAVVILTLLEMRVGSVSLANRALAADLGVTLMLAGGVKCRQWQRRRVCIPCVKGSAQHQ